MSTELTPLIPSVVASVVALVACWFLVRAIVRLIFKGSVASAAEWSRPRQPTRADVFMSAMGDEVGHPWRFGRIILLVVLTPVCFVFTFVVVRGVILAVL
jgi:hypothetical protein